ncbi:hypothetical protein BJ165DRAFT_1523324 [Panaeolus papilionaceus]|nr:hypothetical protein BJ165DRAFT_1523324 [Panaeolus papilionaceus]
MGPTGAGKSSFIEALASDSQSLSISKNQLSGYTQNITAYRLVNVSQMMDSLYCPVYLVDTPGFSDPKISEVEIISMVIQWLKEIGRYTVGRVLFLTPITETRLSGTRRRTIEMLKALLTPHADIGATIVVTTMWDTLYNERTRARAESNFLQLTDEEYLAGGRIITTRFMNDRISALQILDHGNHYVDAFSGDISSISGYLYHDLHERIGCALHQKSIIELDMTQPDAQTNAELKSILERGYKENQEVLDKLILQLANFGNPPAGSEDRHQRLQASIKANAIHRNTAETSVQRSVITTNRYDHQLETNFDSPSIHEYSRGKVHPALSSPVSTQAPKGLFRQLVHAIERQRNMWFHNSKKGRSL